jgi:hypothetical protein
MDDASYWSFVQEVIPILPHLPAVVENLPRSQMGILGSIIPNPNLNEEKVDELMSKADRRLRGIDELDRRFSRGRPSVAGCRPFQSSPGKIISILASMPKERTSEAVVRGSHFNPLKVAVPSSSFSARPQGP